MVEPSSGRVRCIDWLRGFAVIDMILWHAACLLRPDLDRTALADLSGLVAPSFLFAGGFAIALVMVRAAGDPAARRRRALKSLRRIGEVLVVAFLLKAVLRWNEPRWFLKIDILTSIAVCLFAAWPVMLALASRPRAAAAVFVALGAAVLAISPHIPDARWGVAAGSSDFAPTPWAAYVFFGAAAGALGSMGLTGWALAGLVVSGFVLRYVPWSEGLIANAGERFMKFGAIAVAFYAIEREANERGWKLDGPPISLLELVGTSALTAYVVHIWLLFVKTPGVGSYHRAWGGRLGWAGYWMALGTLLGATLFVCWAWPKLVARLRRSSSGAGGV